MNDAGSHPGERRNAGQREAIGGILASALNMEDQISHGVYEEYLDRKRWPGQLDETVFQDICTRLTTLIEDTKRHQRTLMSLSREYGDQGR